MQLASPRVPDAAEIAAMFGISRGSVFRAFRRHEGCTVAEYGRRLRLDRVRQLLRGTDHLISDIAAMCGFCDHAHLDRAFGRTFGESPGSYRTRSAVIRS